MSCLCMDVGDLPRKWRNRVVCLTGAIPELVATGNVSTDSLIKHRAQHLFKWHEVCPILLFGAQ